MRSLSRACLNQSKENCGDGNPLRVKTIAEMAILNTTRALIERELQQQSGCSKTALRNVLSVLSKHDVLREDMQATKRSRKRSMQTSVDQLALAGTPYGPVMQSIELGDLEWDIVNPFAVLHQLSSVSTDFGNLLSNIMETLAPAPLRIVLYVDECQPGNCLRPDYAHKMQRICWTFGLPGLVAAAHRGVACSRTIAVIGWCENARGSAVIKTVLQVFFSECWQ